MLYYLIFSGFDSVENYNRASKNNDKQNQPSDHFHNSGFQVSFEWQDWAAHTIPSR